MNPPGICPCFFPGGGDIWGMLVGTSVMNLPIFLKDLDFLVEGSPLRILPNSFWCRGLESWDYSVAVWRTQALSRTRPRRGVAYGWMLGVLWHLPM